MQFRRIIFSIIAISIALFILIFIHRFSSADVSQQRLNIVTTTSMITDAVKHIGGEKVNVYGLMGPGVDPHLYRARAGDMHKLASADIIFYNGLHLEGKMADVFEQMKLRTTVVPVTKSIMRNTLLHSEFSDLYDPHVWFDVQLWKEAVKIIADALIKKDPENITQYQKRAQSYFHELDMLNSYIQAKVATIPKSQRILVTAHDAFGYFGRAYGFQVIGLQGLSTDSEIGTKDVQNLVSFVVHKKVPAIFVESSVPHRTIEAVQQAAQAHGWEVKLGDELYSDALGSPDSQAGTYIGMVRHNVDAIIKALK